MLSEQPVRAMLPRNNRGGYVFRQSTIGAWQRCAMQAHYLASGAPREQLSATAYGSVVHHALHVLERYGDLDQALATFEHYWHPDNIGELCDPVDVWLPRQTYGGLRSRGLRALRDYADLARSDEADILALEYTFTVPITGTDHDLTGTVDRLTIRKQRTIPYLSLDDHKTGKKPAYLRHAVQGTAYCYATTQRAFWDGFDAAPVQLHRRGELDGAALFELTKTWARRFRWIDLMHIEHHDGGWRSERDYARLRMAVNQIAACIDADIYPMTLSGDTCTYCAFRSICGGIGIASDDEGAPTRRPA